MQHDFSQRVLYAAMASWHGNVLRIKLDSYFVRAYAPRWTTPRANIAPRRCVVNFKYERTRVYACKLPWRLYPLVERDPRKRIWLDGISTPALKVQLGWTFRRTYARIRAQNCTLGVWTVQRMRAYTRARSMNPALVVLGAGRGYACHQWIPSERASQ